MCLCGTREQPQQRPGHRPLALGEHRAPGGLSVGGLVLFSICSLPPSRCPRHLGKPQVTPMARGQQNVQAFDGPGPLPLPLRPQALTGKEPQRGGHLPWGGGLWRPLTQHPVARPYAPPVTLGHPRSPLPTPCIPTGWQRPSLPVQSGGGKFQRRTVPGMQEMWERPCKRWGGPG